MKQFIIIFYISIFVFQGCIAFKPESRNSVPENYPYAYSLYDENEEKLSGKWWETFDSPELNGIIEIALTDNFSIRETWARLEQARASSSRANSGLWPEVTGSASVSRTEAESTDASGNVMKTETDSYALGLAASYELDLWGRVRSSKTAEKLKVQAGEADVETSAMTISASVTENWIDLIATRRELELVNNQVKVNARMLDIQELRFEKSLATALDVLQQMEVVERSKSRIPTLEAKIRTLKHNLLFLLGRPPGAQFEITRKSLPDISTIPKTGLPADLLAMRPDVRAAGFRLKAADWEIAAARANRLPTLSLTGSVTYSADKVDKIFDNWIRNLAAGLAGPIFDAGRRKADVKRTNAVAEERLATYEKTVLNALKEVEDSLVREHKQREHLQALEKQLQAADRALEEAKRYYLKGLGSFLPFLMEQTSVHELQRGLIVQKALLLKYRIALYRAIGGDWMQTLGTEG